MHWSSSARLPNPTPPNPARFRKRPPPTTRISPTAITRLRDRRTKTRRSCTTALSSACRLLLLTRTSATAIRRKAPATNPVALSNFSGLVFEAGKPNSNSACPDTGHALFISPPPGFGRLPSISRDRSRRRAEAIIFEAENQRAHEALRFRGQSGQRAISDKVGEPAAPPLV